jgi:hypothetical protein
MSADVSGRPGLGVTPRAQQNTTGPETLSGPVAVRSGLRDAQNEASCGSSLRVAWVAAPAPLFTTVTV